MSEREPRTPRRRRSVGRERTGRRRRRPIGLVAGLAFVAVGAAIGLWVWLARETRPETIADRMARVEAAIPADVHVAAGSRSLRKFGDHWSTQTFRDERSASGTLRRAGHPLLVTALQLVGVGIDLDHQRIEKPLRERIHAVYLALRSPAVAARRVREDGKTIDALLVVDIWDGRVDQRWRRLLRKTTGEIEPLEVVAGPGGVSISRYRLDDTPGLPELSVAWRRGYLVLATADDLATAALEGLEGGSSRPGLMAQRGVRSLFSRIERRSTLWTWASGSWLFREVMRSVQRGKAAGREPTLRTPETLRTVWRLCGGSGVRQIAFAVHSREERVTEELLVQFDRKTCWELALRRPPTSAPPAPRTPELAECDWIHVDWTQVWTAWARFMRGMAKLQGLTWQAEASRAQRSLYEGKLLSQFVGPVCTWVRNDVSEPQRVSRVRLKDPAAVATLLEAMPHTAAEPIPSARTTVYTFRSRLETPGLVFGLRWIPGPFLGNACMVHGTHLYSVAASDEAEWLLRGYATETQALAWPGSMPSGHHSQARWVRDASTQQADSPAHAFWRGNDSQTSMLGAFVSLFRFLPGTSHGIGALSETVDVENGVAYLRAEATFRDTRRR